MFGTSVALSADGNTALIGGWNDNSAYAATRITAAWRGVGVHALGLG